MFSDCCDDPDFLDMLKVLRLLQPSQEQLDEFQQGMDISDSDTPSHADITSVCDNYPDAVFLTVSLSEMDMCQNCSFCNKSMKLCTVIVHEQIINFRFGAISEN